MSVKKTYSEKLKDPRWQKKRLEILERYEWKCKLCRRSDLELHIHHKEYKSSRQPWEYEDNNFVSLCKICHKIVESRKDEYTVVEVNRGLVDNDKGTGVMVMISHDTKRAFYEFFWFDGNGDIQNPIPLALEREFLQIVLNREVPNG